MERNMLQQTMSLSTVLQATSIWNLQSHKTFAGMQSGQRRKFPFLLIGTELWTD